MKIESVDFFYLSMPEITNAADGSQDALIARITAGGLTGWGECEAAPLPSIAAFIAPKSHGACRPIAESVIGQRLDGPADVGRIGDLVRVQSMDLLQTAHTLSGIDMALWDLVGKKLDAPIYQLIGYPRAYAKTPYASQLFGATPQETLEKCRSAREKGFRATKLGWAPFGTGSVQDDEDHLVAAREGIGEDGILLIDAGTVWIDDLEAAAARLPALEKTRATWLEEPFVSGALEEYAALARRSPKVGMAGGEGAHDFFMAKHMIDYAGLKYAQIDAGRIGGITVAKQVADYAVAKGVTFVNHTFTSHLALCNSLLPFIGVEKDTIAEYPVELQPVAWAVTENHIEVDANGEIRVPEAPGHGMVVDPRRWATYVVDTEIKVGGEVLYRTPAL